MKWHEQSRKTTMHKVALPRRRNVLYTIMNKSVAHAAMKQSVEEASRRIFGHLPHSNCRTGAKYLRKKSIGYKVAAVSLCDRYAAVACQHNRQRIGAAAERVCAVFVYITHRTVLCAIVLALPCFTSEFYGRCAHISTLALAIAPRLASLLTAVLP